MTRSLRFSAGLRLRRSPHAAVVGTPGDEMEAPAILMPPTSSVSLMRVSMPIFVRAMR